MDVVCRFVVEPDTEVVGMSVEAKLILNGVEPFSMDVVGRFV